MGQHKRNPSDSLKEFQYVLIPSPCSLGGLQPDTDDFNVTRETHLREPVNRGLILSSVKWNPGKPDTPIPLYLYVS